MNSQRQPITTASVDALIRWGITWTELDDDEATLHFAAAKRLAENSEHGVELFNSAIVARCNELQDSVLGLPPARQLLVLQKVLRILELAGVERSEEEPAS